MGFFEKISSYDLITSLIPGIFLLEAFRAAGIPFVAASELATWVVLAYALGMLSSRIGSLVIDELAQKFSKRAHSYSDYVKATKADNRIESLVEKATFYRSMLAAGLVYLIGILIFWCIGGTFSDAWIGVTLAASSSILIFLCSYRKQEGYIAQRVQGAEK